MLREYDIVTVKDLESNLCDKQGRVVQIKCDGHKDGPYLVKFGRSCKFLFGHRPPKDGIIRFNENELRRDEKWDISTWADNLYGNRWHHVCTLKNPWSTNNECMHKDHEVKSVKATRRILINCWGSVHEIDACDKHTNLHGMCGENLPFR